MKEILGLDYPTLWFLVVGALFSGYAILDGFDFGAGAWHLFFKKEEDRRIALNAVGPVWDGNEVWLVIGGGALFAGFPVLYASMFSAMYIPFMLFLTFIIFRAISIEFRGKEKMTWWRKLWDTSYSVSSIALGFLLGVVLGNVLQGIAIGPDFEYVGGKFFAFLNPYALVVGLTTVSLFMMHGAIYLLMKTEGKMYQQLRALVKDGIIAFIIMFAIMSIYTIIAFPNLWDSYKNNPVLFLIPGAAFASIANIPRLVKNRKYIWAFICSSLTMSLMLITVAIELYPTLLSSTVSPEYNINIYNAAASEKSLGIMLLITAIGGPLVLLYTFIVYRSFRGKVKLDETSY